MSVMNSRIGSGVKFQVEVRHRWWQQGVGGPSNSRISRPTSRAVAVNLRSSLFRARVKSAADQLVGHLDRRIGETRFDVDDESDKDRSSPLNRIAIERRRASTSARSLLLNV